MSDRSSLLREAVLDLLIKHTKTGKVTLSAGGTTDTYIDCRAATMTGNGQRLIGQLLTKEIVKLIPDHEVYDKTLVIGGMATGGIPLVCAALHYLWISSFLHGDVYGVYVRKQLKPHGWQSQVEGQYPSGNVECILVEDVTTTGTSILKAAEVIRQTGLYINHAVSLVDRDAGARQALAEQAINLHPIFMLSEIRHEVLNSQSV